MPNKRIPTIIAQFVCIEICELGIMSFCHEINAQNFDFIVVEYVQSGFLAFYYQRQYAIITSLPSLNGILKSRGVVHPNYKADCSKCFIPYQNKCTSFVCERNTK